MKVSDIFNGVLASNVDKIMKEWFPYLWISEEDEEDIFPVNYCNQSLFQLRHHECNLTNHDTVTIVEGDDHGFTYRELSIRNQYGVAQNYTLRTWSDFLGLTITNDTFQRFTTEEIAAVLLAELPLNRTYDEAEALRYSLHCLRQAFQTEHENNSIRSASPSNNVICLKPIPSQDELNF